MSEEKENPCWTREYLQRQVDNALDNIEGTTAEEFEYYSKILEAWQTLLDACIKERGEGR